MELAGSIIYFAAIIAASFTMLHTGKDGKDWEYWAILGCMIIARLSARI